MGNTFDSDNQNHGYDRAPDEVIQRFLNSYGVRTSVLAFLPPREETQAQILNREFYDEWIGKVQTRISKQELPFLFYFWVYGWHFFGCFDLTKNKLERKHPCNSWVDGCIQIRQSLFVYDRDHDWSQFSNLHKETATKKALAAPPTKIRTWSLANFDDKLIL